jgi:metal-responsive CopG/Arc/MetJ family transcriptional regulator
MNFPAPRARRITVSLPADLFERGERERRRSHEQRSEFVARLYRRYFQEVEEQDRVARYTAAYGKLPETAEERWLVDQSLGEVAGGSEE